MSTHQPASEAIEELIRHRRFLSALARSLVHDEHRAEDVVQETFVAALEKPPRAGVPLKAWLAAVVRNVAFKDRRSRARRYDRERSVARSEVSLDVQRDLELEEELVAAVRDLEEPFRTVVVLRHHRGLAYERIARDIGVPVNTVKSRLRRGLERLRRELDARHGGRRSTWILAIAPLARSSGAGPTPWISGASVMKSTTFVATASLALVLGSWWASAPDAAVSEAVPGPGESATRVATPEPSEVDSPAGPAASTPRATVAAAGQPPERDVAPSPPPMEVEAVAMLTGRVVVLDADGGRHETESGVLGFSIRDASNETSNLQVEVDGGRWSAERPEGAASLIPTLARLGGRPCTVEFEPVTIPEDGELELRVRWPRDATLHVLAADTGAALNGVVVVQRVIGMHPGDSYERNVVLRSASSPVALPKRSGLGLWGIRAPGYAWGQIQVNHASGGEHAIHLQPDTTLEVIPTGAEPGEAKLRVISLVDADSTHEIYRFAAEFSFRGREAVVIEGLPPGPYEVRGELGDRLRPFVLGRAEVELAARERREVELVLDAAPTTPERLTAAGRVALSGTEGAERVAVVLAPVEVSPLFGAERIELTDFTIPVDHDGPTALHWELEDFPPGRWQIEVRPYRCIVEYAVTPENARHLDVTLPDLFPVTLHVLDDATGGPAFTELDDQLSVAWWRPDGPRPGPSHGLARDPDDFAMRFLAPAGPIRVETWAPAMESRTDDFEIEPGANELTVHVRPATTIVLTMAHAGALVPIDITRQPSVEAIGGAGELAGISMDWVRNEYHVQVTEPGRYRVWMEAMSGYAETSGVVVDAVAGETVEAVLELELAR